MYEYIFFISELGKTHLSTPASIISSDKMPSKSFIVCLFLIYSAWLLLRNCVKTPAAKTQDLTSILRTHLVGETQLLNVLWRPHVFCDTHTNTLNKFKRNYLSALPYLTLHIPTPKMILVLCFMNLKKWFDTHNGVFRWLFETRPLYLGRAGWLQTQWSFILSLQVLVLQVCTATPSFTMQSFFLCLSQLLIFDLLPSSFSSNSFFDKIQSGDLNKKQNNHKIVFSVSKQ